MDENCSRNLTCLSCMCRCSSATSSLTSWPCSTSASLTRKRWSQSRPTSLWTTTRRRSLRTASRVCSPLISPVKAEQCSTVTAVVLTPVYSLSSSAASERLTQEQADDLMSWMKNALGPRVTNIKVKIKLQSSVLNINHLVTIFHVMWNSGLIFHVNLPENHLQCKPIADILPDTFSSSGPQLTPRLDTHPAMITVLEMGAARHFLRTQQLARTAEERAQILQPTLEINAGWEMEGCVVGLISLDGIITFR